MVFAIGLVVAVVLGVIVTVGVYLTKQLRITEQTRSAIATVGGFAFRFTYWNGTDGQLIKQRLELAILYLNEVWPTSQLYALLDGLHVNVVDAAEWKDVYSGRMVAGIANPSTKTVTVGKDLRALAHELAHVMEAGAGRLVPSGPEHDRWTEKGIQGAIDKYEAAL